MTRRGLGSFWKCLKLSAIITLFSALFLGCVGFFDLGSGYDKRALTVETLSLFNQRQTSRLAKRSWAGDWIFRRARLELIDSSLRNLKPDILILQEVLAKRGATAESDQAILTAGSLANYAWRLDEVEDYPDTQEEEHMAFALALPHKFASIDGDTRQTWNMGTGGYLAAATVEYEGQPVDVFNVKLPDKSEGYQIWYNFIQERILERLRIFRHCSQRVILAGLMPGSEDNPKYQELLREARLKDTAAGFCQIPSRCYTATPSNEIFMATEGDQSPSRMDRVLVSDTAYVYTGARAFDEADTVSRFTKEFGLNQLWPTQRFGWMTQVRLGRCSKSDMEPIENH